MELFERVSFNMSHSLFSLLSLTYKSQKMSQWQSCENDIFLCEAFEKDFFSRRERFCPLISLPRFRLSLFLLGGDFQKKETPASADWAIKNRHACSLVGCLAGCQDPLILSFLLSSTRMLQDRGLWSQPGLLEKVLQLKKTHCSPYLLAFLFDCYEDALESGSLKNHPEDQQQETLQKALEVRVWQDFHHQRVAVFNDQTRFGSLLTWFLFFFQICQLLAQEKDTIRKEYWLFLGRSLKNKFGDASEEPPEPSP